MLESDQNVITFLNKEINNTSPLGPSRERYGLRSIGETPFRRGMDLFPTSSNMENYNGNSNNIGPGDIKSDLKIDQQQNFDQGLIDYFHTTPRVH